MIVLDTNVISELMRPSPSPVVRSWLDAQSAGNLWTATLCVAEVLSGLELMAMGKRQSDLRMRAKVLFSTLFKGRTLDFTPAAAEEYGHILALRYAFGRPIDPLDALIAATVMANGGALATRNIRDFENCGIELIDPWSG